ncbi:glutamyl-tRNA reductase [Halalkalicoccus tibetensis]|uniref:Glutamyl-tRNA reductase n=1 Tax=Halalkalicoccus tibetensis TaxID=175632 RepID=A0ABD5UYD5_9EURY
MSGGVIIGVRITHETASVDRIDDACRLDQRALVEDLLDREGVSEAFALQTCNRAEAYVVTPDPAVGRAALGTWAGDLGEAAVWTGHEESLRHLLRVAAGLESLVLGEDQIIGQVREAYTQARGVGALGGLLEDALLKAIHVGERARTETAINEGVVSLGSAAVSLVAADRDIEDATALVVGAGEMGTLAAQALSRHDLAELVVANRTRSRAEHVASELPIDAEARSLSALERSAADADVVIAATGSDEPVLDASLFVGECTVVDLAKPRDVDPRAGELEGVAVYDLDDLETVTDRTERTRAAAAREVETMIDEELDHLLEQFKRRQADDVISGMYEGAERTKRAEVTTAISKLESQGDLTDEQRETVEAMADALVGQLLSAPTRSLREAAAEDDWETINTAIQLFDPADDEDGEGPMAPRKGIGPEGSEIPPEVAARIEDD